MSGMTAQAEALRALIVDQEAKALSHDVAGKIRTRAGVAREAAEELQVVLAAADALAADGLRAVAMAEAQRDEAKRCAANLRRMAGKLERSDGDEAVIEPLLGGAAVDEGRRVVKTIVKIHVDALRKALDAERVSFVPANIDAPIPDIPKKAALKIRLTRLRAELTTEVRLTAEDLTDIDSLRRRRARIKESVAEWHTARSEMDEAFAAFDPAMQDFLLLASGPDGAPLSALTADLRAKLVEAGTADHFRIHRTGGES